MRSTTSLNKLTLTPTPLRKRFAHYTIYETVPKLTYSIQYDWFTRLFLSPDFELTHSLKPGLRRLWTGNLHLARSATTLRAVSTVRPLIFRALRRVRLQVSFGRPLFRFPWGVQTRATLGSELEGWGGGDGGGAGAGGFFWWGPVSLTPQFYRAALRSR